MTFTNDQLREIERVNLILLKKIMAHRKPRSNGTVVPPPPRKTSAAVNRAKTEKNIEKDNMVCLKHHFQLLTMDSILVREQPLYRKGSVVYILESRRFVIRAGPIPVAITLFTY